MHIKPHTHQRSCRQIGVAALALGLAFAPLTAFSQSAADAAPAWKEGKFNDSHFHLTNYIQEGTPMPDLLTMMGERIERSTVFGIPLQQMWDHNNTGDYAPTYYLQSDAPLYYYSFTDADIAMAYKALPVEQQQRLDPMIIGFNPADMYAADHIRRVLLTFPGVWLNSVIPLNCPVTKVVTQAKAAPETMIL